MKHVATITGLRRTHDGELVADANLRDSGLIHGMANTVDNFQMDEEILLLAIRRSEADELWNDIGRVAEIVEQDFSVEDARRLWDFAEQFKPDEPVPFLVNSATV